MLAGGLAFGRLAKLVRLPNVTGYLVAGLVLGPCLLKLIPGDVVGSLGVIPDAALGFIAFSVGGEFKLSYIRRVGMTPIVIAFLEALGATLLVASAMLLAGQPAPFALMMGAIAAATAPAATIMVIRQYKAKGPVTETLLTVVALDDAVALMLFGIAIAIAQELTASSGNLLLSILSPVYQILGSLLLGGILGALFTLPLRFFRKPGNRLSCRQGGGECGDHRLQQHRGAREPDADGRLRSPRRAGSTRQRGQHQPDGQPGDTSRDDPAHQPDPKGQRGIGTAGQ